MLNKETDYIILGENFISYLLAISLLEKQRSVILLDENRINYGDNFISRMTYLEAAYLKSWGSGGQISPLMSIHKYLKSDQIVFVYGSKQLRLGGDPVQNAMELARKLPSVFQTKNKIIDFLKDKDIDLINQEVTNYIDRFSLQLFFQKSYQAVDLSTLRAQAPKLVEMCYQSIVTQSRSMEKNTDSKMLWRNMLYLLRGHFHKKLLVNATDFEYFLLTLQMLSPSYSLNHSLLSQDMKEVFERKGGQYKSSNVKDWIFYKNRPWGLELDCYEGAIRPGKVCILGSTLTNLPIYLLPKLTFYQCLNVHLKLVEDVYLTDGLSFICSNSLQMGTNIPFYEVVKKDNILEVKLYILFEEGSKESFYEKDVFSILQKDLKKIIVQNSKDLWPKAENIISQNLSSEIYIAGEKVYEKQNFGHKTIPYGKLTVHDYSLPSGKDELKDVSYFGPYRKSSFGLMSTAMEINEKVEYF